MSWEFLVFIAILVVTFVARAPIGLSMVSAGVVYMVLAGRDLGDVSALVLGGMNSKFILIAVPLFIFTAQIMNNSSISDKYFDLAHSLVGKVRGGLAQVDVLQSVGFSGISGSAIADASGPGLMVTRAQIRAGYPPALAVALNASSATIGPIMPPSIPLVMYGYVAAASVGMLFAAGLIPGLLLAVMLMIYIAVIARIRNLPTSEWLGWRALWHNFITSIPALLAFVILMGGIYTGLFTPTEAAAVAAIYAIAIAFLVYRSMDARKFWNVCRASMRQSAGVTMIIGGALIVSHIVAAEGVGADLARLLLSVTDNGVLLLLLVNVAFLILGMFLDTMVLMLVMVPIVLPAMTAVGVDPIHLGVVLVLNMMIGLSTPPMGVMILLLSSLTKVPIGAIIKEILPFVGAMIVLLVILVLAPDLSLWLPRLLGYGG